MPTHLVLPRGGPGKVNSRLCWRDNTSLCEALTLLLGPQALARSAWALGCLWAQTEKPGMGQWRLLT